MGLIAFSDNFWKYVSSTECPWHSLDQEQSWAPVIQRSLPAPSCLGVSRICGLVEGPGKHPSRFLSSVQVNFCRVGFRHILGSPLSFCGTWRCNGLGAFAHPGKQAATAGKRFFSYPFYSPSCQVEGFSHLIYVTTKCYSSY